MLSYLPKYNENILRISAIASKMGRIKAMAEIVAFSEYMNFTGFLFLGRLGSRANTEKKIGGQLWATFKVFFHVFMGKKSVKNLFILLQTCKLQTGQYINYKSVY